MPVRAGMVWEELVDEASFQIVGLCHLQVAGYQALGWPIDPG